MGKLYFERGRYFITKMEQSLRNIEVEPFPILEGKQQMKHISIAIIKSMQDDQPTVQLDEVCHAIVQTQK